MSYEKLVEENLGLVHSCCHRMKNRGIDYEELYSAGCMGIVKAAKKFDPSLGFNFSTYAVPVILGEIKRLFRENNPVKVSRTLKELSLKVSRTKDRLSVTLNREPTISEISKEIGVSTEEVAEALSASVPVMSLTTEDENGEEIDVPVINQEDKIINEITINQVLNSFEENDKKLIELRFFKDKTQMQTAKILGMSQVQVSRREKILLIKLKNRLIC